MPTSYLPYQPTQDLLLPPSLRDWLPQDHLARYVSDTIDELDRSALYRRHDEGGGEYRSHKPPQPHKPAPFQPRLAPVTGSPQR